MVMVLVRTSFSDRTRKIPHFHTHILEETTTTLSALPHWDFSPGTIPGAMAMLCRTDSNTVRHTPVWRVAVRHTPVWRVAVKSWFLKSLQPLAKSWSQEKGTAKMALIR